MDTVHRVHIVERIAIICAQYTLKNIGWTERKKKCTTVKEESWKKEERSYYQFERILDVSVTTDIN